MHVAVDWAEKVHAAIELRLGNFIPYSSSKLRFFGLTPFSPRCEAAVSFRVRAQLRSARW